MEKPDLDYLEEMERKEVNMVEVSDAAYEMAKLEQEIMVAEEKLKLLKKDYDKLSGETIPELILGSGLSECKLKDGRSVTVTKDIRVNLPKTDKDKRKDVLRFITDNGGGSIIKRKLTIEEPEEHVKEYLRKHCIGFSDDMDIHHSTLKAWFKDALGMKKGSIKRFQETDIPGAASLFVFHKTKVK